MRADGAETIVVGAGAAGAVVAARVTEDSAREVLLVEAGPDHLPEALPADLANGKKNSYLSHDWGWWHRVNSGGLQFPYPRGRVVGGSSAVNTCIALRGRPADYDAWAERGLVEWSWQHCLPAFVRLERDLDFEGPVHGRDGPLPIRRHPPGELVPWQAAFVEACREAGFPACPDLNLPDAEGVGPHPMNKVAGRRISVAEAYLTPAVRARANLRVLPRTLVVRVRFEGRRAIGVEVEREGRQFSLHASRVVLAAGAIATPGLLLRSGVGPKAELDRLAVRCVADVPGVGARLLDHPGVAAFFRPRRGVGSLHHPLIQTALRTSSGREPGDLLVQPGSLVPLPWVDLPWACSMMVQLGRPKGHGRLRFASADPRAAPVIESRILEHPDDVDVAVDAMRRIRALTATGPMADLVRPLTPRPSVWGHRQRIARWVRRSCDSGYHPCGTAPMGADDDPSAACDGRGRVRGTEGLVVADASLMPSIPAANTHLPTVMIGERMGAWLRARPD